MSYVQGEDRRQAALLPAAIEDYVTADAPVRVINAFVDGLNVSELGFGRSVPAPTGRPPYNPRDLLKLYIWGYFNEVRSSRRLERECRRNVEAMWLLRRLSPDFTTIADFRRDNGVAAVASSTVWPQSSMLKAARQVSKAKRMRGQWARAMAPSLLPTMSRPLSTPIPD